MKTPFRSQPKITQNFAERPEYYKQFKLKGHEGIDLIPSGTVWDVLALEDGVIVLDDDVVGSVSSDPYGKIVTIWHTKINKATMYCHLSENFVSLGQIVKKGEKIGTMGSTGNSSGAHLHLNLFETDSNGVRQNRDNGFLGGIDPLPFLQEESQPVTSDTIIQQSDSFIAVCTELGVTATKDAALAKIKGYKEQLITLEDRSQKLSRSNEKLSVEIGELKKSLSTEQDTNKTLQENYRASQALLEQSEAKMQGFEKTIKELEEKIKTPDMTPMEHFILAIKGFLHA